jgi:hypothetical protein
LFYIDAGDVILMKGSILLMFVMLEVVFEWSKSVQILSIFPLGLEPIAYTSVALMTPDPVSKFPPAEARHYYH